MRHPQDQPNCSWGLAPLPLRQPQPYIAICSLKACCASQGLDTLYPLAWAPDGKPQRSWQASGPFHGHIVCLTGCGLPAFLPWRRGDGLLRGEDWRLALVTDLEDPSLEVAFFLFLILFWLHWSSSRCSTPALCCCIWSFL